MTVLVVDLGELTGKELERSFRCPTLFSILYVTGLANVIDAHPVFCSLFSMIAISIPGQCHPDAAKPYLSKEETSHNVFNPVTPAKK